MPTPASVVNPSFEGTQPDGTSPPWQTYGAVAFTNNSANATSDNFYADLIASSADYGIAGITQTINGLNTSSFYILNMTVTVIQNAAGCYLSAYVVVPYYSNYFFRYVFDDNTPSGPMAFFGTAQPPSTSSDLQIDITCQYSDPGVCPTFELHVDNISLVQPDLSNLMYLQVVDPTNASGLNGSYVQAQTPSYTSGSTAFTSDVNNATQYALDPYGHVFFSSASYYDFSFWNQDTSSQTNQNGIEAILYNKLDAQGTNNFANRVPPPYSAVLCSIDQATTLYLSCSSWDGDSFLSVFNDELALGNQAASIAQGAIPISSEVVYVNP